MQEGDQGQMDSVGKQPEGQDLMRFVRFCYLSHDNKRRFPHQLRDGDAALELFETLKELKFNYGGVLINWPFPDGVPDTSMERLKSLDVNKSDILLLTTRPPLHDKDPEKKKLRESGEELERKIFTELFNKCFQECSRTTITVRRHIKFSPGYENRMDVEYFASRRKDPGQALSEAKNEDEELVGDASYHKLGGEGGKQLSKEEMERRSAGYIVHLPLGEGLPRLLAVFGLSGTLTLLWAYWLGKKENLWLLEKVLKNPEQGYFVMAEITTTSPIPQRPLTFESCLLEMGWEVKIIAERAI